MPDLTKFEMIYRTDPDGLWGQPGSTGYDADASVAEYQRLVTAAILAEYPNATIEHQYEPTMRDGVEILSDGENEYPEIAETIEQIATAIYEDFQWLVK